MTKTEKTEAVATAADDAPKAGVLKLSSLRSDTRAQEEGAWNESTLLPGVKLKTRSINYVPYRIARDKLLTRLARQFGKDQSRERDVAAAKGFGRLYAEHILLDWEGFDVAFSGDLALEELTRPDAVTLRAAIEECAERTGLPDAEFVEDAAKN